MASRGGHSGIGDSSRNGAKRHDSNKENTSQQGLNAFRMQKDRQTEWARPGRVFNRNTNRGGYSRSSLPGFTQEFRIVKDNRIKLNEAGVSLPEASHNSDSSNECSVSNVGDKCSTEKLAEQHCLVTPNVNGHGAAQANNGIKSAAQAHDKEVKPSSVRKLEQPEGMQATLVGSHAILGKGNQNRVDNVSSRKNNFGGELCCSSSDPIHVPSPGSKSAGTFGAIKREVGVVGARQRPSDGAATNTSTSNSLAKVTSAPKDTNERNGHFNLPVPLSGRASHHVNHTKVSPHLEWKPKSISPSSVNHEVIVVPPGVNSHQAEVAGLSKKLSQANVSQDEHVIIPEHIRVPDSERTHLIFGSFESEVDPKASVTASHTVVSKEDLNDRSPSSSLAALNSIISTDVAHNDKTDHVGSCSPLPQPESVVSVSEHQQSLTESVEDPSLGVVVEYGTNEMISSKVTHSQPQLHHQDNPAIQNFKAYEPDSRYAKPFITKTVDGETAQSIAYPSEAMGMGLHPANAYQLPASGATQQPLPQMYPQQFQVPQYPNFLPYRHVFSPQYGPSMVVSNYSSNPAFPQLPHTSSYLVMPNGASQLAANGMKYGSSHQYKQVFQGTPAGYGGYANHNCYPVSNSVIGSTGVIEDVNMNKYKDNGLYAPNAQAETADLWVQGHREIPNMPSAPFYNMVGQPVSPHAPYLTPHNGHHPSFSPVHPHPAHLQYPGFPQALHPTSMTMVQNPQAMVHQPGAPPTAGNLGLDMAAMAPGSQVGAFQQNQLGHLGKKQNVSGAWVMPSDNKMLLREMDGVPFNTMPNYDFLSGNGYSMKQLIRSNSDRDSSSTKSEQSRQDLSAVSDSSLNGQHTPTQSDNNDSCGKRDQGMMKSVLSFGNPEAAFPPPKFDYSQPFACASYTADPYYGGVLTGYTPNAIVYPQINGAPNSRVPLPVEPAAEEPIFVNAKQYHAILRRRQMRAKLEAQNKLVKGRKPYLHESRHRHAMKRVRGPGGRFLTKKELQEQQQKPIPSLQTPTGRVGKMAFGRNLCPGNSTSHSPSTSSGISSVSNGGGMLAHQEHISFSSTNFLHGMNFRAENGGEKMAVNGIHHHTPS
ncbi:hypothetical protein BAE44_0004146 [Dichanthelium oligosanthes]|uniref:Nuclear transcription factor Y subunit n=1 Tax=Dichanthelium oligosanthes TaxID=888268 RepID=A0A1E5WC90_9POAL|nr:hypothetical protein BAE44_0004146 [Dichanthelium oligosanthes]